MNAYRPLSVREIAVLQQQGCRADDWSHIQVKDGFTPEAVEQVRFYGPVRLGVFHRTLEPEPGIHRPSGIRQAELHDVTVGDDCLIEQVGCLSRYDIAPGAYISRVGTMSMEPSATCGLGTPVNVLSEADAAFRVWLHRRLGAQEFYLRSRLSSAGCRALDAWVKAEVEASIPSRGVVGADACIVGVSRLRNVYVGASAVIDGASCVEDCYLDSCREAPVRLGTDVICRRTVLQGGAEVLDGAKVSECLVGQAVHVGKGFSAEASLFFANSYLDNGEACAVCAGPFTVSHHKSTLLIGSMSSFFNAGSGTNMSNHMYKLGPLHHGELERGCKTASGAHLVWGGRVGAFSMVMGKFDCHADLSAFPFSYLFHTDGRTVLVPAINFFTVGTCRDVHKWPVRDKRPEGVPPCDFISTCEALTPYTVSRIREGRMRLEQLLHAQEGNTPEWYEPVRGVFVKAGALERGIGLYRLMEQLYIARYLPEETSAELCIPLRPDEEWHDMLGLVVPGSAFRALCDEASDGRGASLQEFLDKLGCLCLAYPVWVQTHIRALYSAEEREEARVRRAANEERFYALLEADVSKEERLGGTAFAPLAAAFREQLHREKEEQLKKAKERASSPKPGHD